MSPANLGAVRRLLLTSAVLASFSVPLTAQVVEKGRTFADLTATHPCSSAYLDRIARVTDCDAADDIGNGEGAFQCWATCDGSAPWTNLSIGGGGAGGGAGDVLLAGDADGQVIQGISGSDQARVDIGVTDTTSARLLGSGATPAIAFADDQYAGIKSPDTNSDCQVTNGAAGCNSDGAVSFLVNPAGYFGATSTSFYAGSPSGATSIGLSDGAFRVTYAQTPPTNANDACTTGDTIDTATFHYYCAATDTWVRVAMATWP